MSKMEGSNDFFFFKHTRDMSNLVPGISVVDLFVLMIMSHI